MSRVNKGIYMWACFKYIVIMSAWDVLVCKLLSFFFNWYCCIPFPLAWYCKLVSTPCLALFPLILWWVLPGTEWKQCESVNQSSQSPSYYRKKCTYNRNYLSKSTPLKVHLSWSTANHQQCAYCNYAQVQHKQNCSKQTIRPTETAANPDYITLQQLII